MRRWLLALTVCLVSMNAFAETAYDEIYQHTYARCSHTLNDSGEVDTARMIWKMFHIRAMREGFKQSFVVLTANPVEIATLIQTRGLTPRVATLLDSPSFHQALIDCYGNNQTLIKTYIAGLVLSDSTGKALGVATQVGIGIVLGRMLAPVLALHPLVRFAFATGSAGLAYYHVQRAYQDYVREATPEEKAAAEAMIAGPIQKGEELVVGVQKLLEAEIENLKSKINTVSEDERSKMAARIELLQSHLDKLRSLGSTPIETKAPA